MSGLLGVKFSPGLIVPWLAAPPPPTGDPHFASVVLLLGMEGTNGATGPGAFVDQSPSPKTPSSANPVLTTTAPLVGLSSGSFSGANVGIRYPNNVAWRPAVGPYTVELDVAHSAAGATYADYIGCWNGGGGSGWVLRLYNAKLQLQVCDPSGNIWTICEAPFAPVQNQRYKLAWDRSGDNWKVYVDGAVHSSATVARTVRDHTIELRVGQIDGGDIHDFVGKMDEVRITKGVGRYAGAYTPISGAFPRGLTRAARAPAKPKAKAKPRKRS